MWKIILVATLAFAAIDRDREFTPKARASIGEGTYSVPFEFEFDIFINAGTQPGSWRGIINYGGDAVGNRGMGCWLHPSSTRLHVRTTTDKNANDGCDPTTPLPQGKWTTVRVLVESKRVTVSINGKPTTCKYSGGGVWKPQGKKAVRACSAAQCFSGKLRGIEAFNNLPPVFSQCAKLKTMAAAKMSKLEGEAKACERAIPQHQAAEKAHNQSCADYKEVEELCNKLKTIARKTVDALLELLKKLKKECTDGAAQAKSSCNAATGRLGECKHQLKSLKTNKVSCKCAQMKADYAKPIAQRRQQITDIEKVRPGYLKAIQMCKDQITAVTQSKTACGVQFANPMFAFLKNQMTAMFDSQLEILRTQKVKLENDMKVKDTEKTGFLAYIKKYTTKIEDCAKELASMKKALSFLYDDADLNQLVDELEYFDDMESMELWSENVNLEAFENEVEVEETTFETEEDVEGVSTTQGVSYGLIGGAGVLTSGLFYYAYQRKNSD